MSQGTALVLDFDGVICDSIDECFESSWIAYQTLYRGRSPTQAPSGSRHAFARLRPFVRNGKDFLLIQEIIESGRDVKDQAGFDAIAREYDGQRLETFEELFDSARARLFAQDRSSWLGKNRVYPHVQTGLSRLPKGAPFFVLSTKRPQFIAEILGAAGFDIPAQRIRFSGEIAKLSFLEDMRIASGVEKTVFIDDQIDHLLGRRPPAAEIYLASWGYVKGEWLREPTAVPVLSPDGFLALIDREFPRD